jgi:serine/threonine protein kinase
MSTATKVWNGSTNRSGHQRVQHREKARRRWPRSILLAIVWLKNNLAVKVLKGGQGDLQERMQREGIVQFQLSHPNIVKLTDMFEEAGRLYLVMEFVDADTALLRDALLLEQFLQ